MNLWIWSKLFFFSAGFSEDMNLMSMFLPMRSLGSLCESSFHQPYRIGCGWGDIELGSWISYCELKRRSSPLDFLLFRQSVKHVSFHICSRFDLISYIELWFPQIFPIKKKNPPLLSWRDFHVKSRGWATDLVDSPPAGGSASRGGWQEGGSNKSWRFFWRL